MPLHIIALHLLLLLVAPSAIAASPWIEISGDDFVLVTNLSEKKARTLLRDFEVFQFAVSRLLTVGAETRPRIATYVFALDSGDFSAIIDGKDVAGVFHGGPFANHVVYEHARRDSRARRVVFHEYIHFILHNNPGFIYPAWYNEGLAELFSTLIERDGALHFGRAAKERAYTIAYLGLIPTEQMLEIDYRSPDFRAHRLLPQFYAQAWLMAHYLMIGNQEHARQVQKFLAEVNAGASPAQAMMAAFGVDPAQLHVEIERYWKSRKLRAWRGEFADPLPTVEHAPLRVLSASEAQALLGFTTLRMGKGAQRASRFFDRALEQDPANPLACAGAAIVKDAEGKADEATALLEQALMHPEAVRAQLAAAALLLTRGAQALEKNADDPEGRASALRARERYRSLLPDAVANNEAAYGYARAAMLVGEPETSDVLAVVRQATARLPTNASLAHLEASLSLATGDLATASAAASRAVRYATSFEQRKAMLELVESVEKHTGGEAADKSGR